MLQEINPHHLTTLPAALLITADLNTTGHAGANIQCGFIQTQYYREGSRIPHSLTNLPSNAQHAGFDRVIGIGFQSDYSCLACPLTLSGSDFWGFYHDRWPIEQLPLASKPMVGAQRQFVFAEESCYRLPELSLLAGSILTFLAATLPPIPTGF
jgi:hypothetical protein